MPNGHYPQGERTSPDDQVMYRFQVCADTLKAMTEEENQSDVNLGRELWDAVLRIPVGNQGLSGLVYWAQVLIREAESIQAEAVLTGMSERAVIANRSYLKRREERRRAEWYRGFVLREKAIQEQADREGSD